MQSQNQEPKTTTVKQDTGGNWKTLGGSSVSTVKQDTSGGYKTISGRPISASQVTAPKQA